MDPTTTGLAYGTPIRKLPPKPEDLGRLGVRREPHSLSVSTRHLFCIVSLVRSWQAQRRSVIGNIYSALDVPRVIEIVLGHACLMPAHTARQSDECSYEPMAARGISLSSVRIPFHTI